MRQYGFLLKRGDKVRRIWTNTNLSRELYQLGLIEDENINLVYEWWLIDAVDHPEHTFYTKENEQNNYLEGFAGI